jgi:hypothetical protein
MKYGLVSVMMAQREKSAANLVALAFVAVMMVLMVAVAMGLFKRARAVMMVTSSLATNALMTAKSLVVVMASFKRGLSCVMMVTNSMKTLVQMRVNPLSAVMDLFGLHKKSAMTVTPRMVTSVQQSVRQLGVAMALSKREKSVMTETKIMETSVLIAAN